MSPKELHIYLPNDNKRAPMELARELVAALDAGWAEFGVDALTGGVEVRLYYNVEVLRQARAFLEEQGAIFDISAH